MSERFDAQKARELSEQNEKKVAERIKNSLIERIDNGIENAIRMGRYHFSFIDIELAYLSYSTVEKIKNLYLSFNYTVGEKRDRNGALLALTFDW